jgi:hypothetical protein
MKTLILISIMLVLSTYSCCGTKIIQDEKYQPLGTAVLAANDLLLVKYSHDRPEQISESEYKNLLKEDYQPMYERLLPFSVEIKKSDDNYIVRVYDEEILILTDWLCTESRIDCWSYNRECTPDDLQIECDK